MNRNNKLILMAKAYLGSLKFSKVLLNDDSQIQFEGDTIEAGKTVYLVDAAGDESVLPDGDYTTKDSGVQFSIKDGSVASSDAPASGDTATSGSTSGDTTTSATTEVKQSEVVPTDTPATETTVDPAAVLDTALTIGAMSDLIDKKLLPVWDAINGMQQANIVWSKQSKDTQKALNTVIDSVVQLSKLPNGTQIETEVAGIATVPQDIKNSKAYRIAQAAQALKK